MTARVIAICTMGLCFLISAPARASLITFSSAPGLVYDSTQNITWLMDADYANTTGYASNGVMTQAAASTWASNLVIVSGGVVYNNWRLPGTPGTGNNRIEGEMGMLYLLYGITSSSPGPFVNLSDQDYWTSQIVGAGPYYYYFTFAPSYLGQYSVDGSYTGWSPHAMAVFDGAPTLTAPVPEPATVVLLGTGLAWLAARRRPKKRA